MNVDTILNRVPRARGVYASLRQKKTVSDGITVEVSAGPGTMFYDYQPGNGTRYALLFTSLTGGAGTNIKAGSQLVTDLLSGRAAVLAPSGFLAPGYISEKLGMSEADGAVVAEFIGHVMRRDAWAPDQYILNVFSEEVG